MSDVSGDRPRDDRQKRSSRRAGQTEDRYRLLHTTLFVLGGILLIAAIIITVITIVASVF